MQVFLEIMHNIEPRQRKKLHKLLKMGKSDAMSSDEEGSPTSEGLRRFWIRKSAWKSAAFTAFVRLLDGVRRRRRVERRGPEFRIRYEGENVSRRAAPVGLPEACYAPEYLNSLTPAERAALCVVKTSIDFELELSLLQ